MNRSCCPCNVNVGFAGRHEGVLSAVPSTNSRKLVLAFCKTQQFLNMTIPCVALPLNSRLVHKVNEYDLIWKFYLHWLVWSLFKVWTIPWRNWSQIIEPLPVRRWLASKASTESDSLLSVSFELKQMRIFLKKKMNDMLSCIHQTILFKKW